MAVNRAQIEIAARDATGAAFAQVGSRFRGLQGDIDGLASRFSALQTAFAVGLGGAGLSAFLQSTIDGIDRLNDLADATGASIENLSALEDVGARTGTSMDTVSAAVLKMNKVLADAKPGSDQARVLQLLGLSAAELRKQDPAESLRSIAVALAGFSDDANKARIVQELFGKSTREVSAFLKDLAGSGTLNATVITGQAKQAERFNQQLDAMAKNSRDVARSFTADLLPALNKFLERLNGNTKGLGFFGSLGEEIKANLAADGLRVVVAEIESVQAAIDRQGATPLLAKRLAELREEAGKLTQEAQQASDKLKGFANVAVPLPQGRRPAREGGGGLASRNLPDLPDKDSTKSVSELQKYIEKIEAAQIATLELSAEEQARIDIVTGRLGKLTSAQEDQVLSLARGLDLLRKGSDFRGPEIPADLLAARQAQAKAIDQLISSSTGARFEALTRTQQALGQQFIDGQITALDYARATESLGKAFEDLEPKIKAVEEASSAFAEQAARNIQDALADSIESAFDGKARSIESIWRNLLKRLVAQAAAANLSEALFGAGYGQKGSQIGGLLGALFSSFSGSGGGLNYSGQFDGFRAGGGSVTAGRAYVVGERGPEIMVPRSSGTVLPNGMGIGGTSVVVNVNGDATERSARRTAMAVRMVLAERDAARV